MTHQPTVALRPPQKMPPSALRVSVNRAYKRNRPPARGIARSSHFFIAAGNLFLQEFPHKRKASEGRQFREVS